MIPVSYINKFKLLCTPELITIGTVAAGERISRGKPIIGQDIIPRPKQPVVKPPPDLSGEEKRRRLRETERGFKPAPSGRRANIRSRVGGTGAAPIPRSILKTNLGG